MKKHLHILLWLALPAAIALLALHALGVIGGSAAKTVEQKKYQSEGFVYTGTLLQGKFNGMGELTFSNGDAYNGGFLDGRMDGEGTYTSAAGWRYEGTFRQGAMTQDGVLYAESGDILRREEDIYAFVSAQGWDYTGGLGERGQTGNGRFVFADGSVYEGGFSQGLAEGQGRYTAPDGTTVSGVWEKGALVRLDG